MTQYKQRYFSSQAVAIVKPPNERRAVLGRCRSKYLSILVSGNSLIAAGVRFRQGQVELLPVQTQRPRRLSLGGENEFSQVPGQPLHNCPALRTRRATHTRLYGVSNAAFRQLNDVGAASHHSRGSITRPAHSLCTLRSRGHNSPCIGSRNALSLLIIAVSPIEDEISNRF